MPFTGSDVTTEIFDPARTIRSANATCSSFSGWKKAKAIGSVGVGFDGAAETGRFRHPDGSGRGDSKDVAGADLACAEGAD